MRHHLTPVRRDIINKSIRVGKGAEKREPMYTVDRNVNWYSHCGKQYRSSSKKLRLELPYNPAILLLGIFLKKKN